VRPPSRGESSGECEGQRVGTPRKNRAKVPTAKYYAKLLYKLDIEAVKKDMRALLKQSKDCWPADDGNYGPFMVRLAWHCSGTYREDENGENGMGGCAGGRQLFEPERSWEDNTNLDKARALLVPLKEKYGDALSWGDLMVLAGTTAYREAGMPVSRMCFGRIDEKNGRRSLLFGPSREQEAKFPCAENGNCDHPLPTTLGLIYVNPEGPFADATNFTGSAQQVRRTFRTMGQNDRGTVALIGGGHAIGKVHGACPDGAGNPPREAFKLGTPIWQGGCGNGKGENTVTSGFEGPWTADPNKFDNEYFKYLLTEEWVLSESPAGHSQYVLKKPDPYGRIRLTADLALIYDKEYKKLVKEFAYDMDAFTHEFDKAWDRLTTQNGDGEWSEAAFCDDGSAPPKTRLTMRYDDMDIE